MKELLPARAILIALTTGLSACGTVTDGTALTSDLMSTDHRIKPGDRADVVGTMMDLPEENPLGVSQAKVVEEYHAASGRLCRRVDDAQARGRSRIMCQRSDGQWNFTRALLTSNQEQQMVSGIRAALTMRDAASANAAITALDDRPGDFLVSASEDISDVSLIGPSTALNTNNSAPPMQLRLKHGETLWRFAARTTGNPENWRRIAESNGITDVNTMKGGVLLTVPAELYSGSR